MAKEPKIIRGKMWPLSKIIPYEHNPRTHPEAQIKLLADLIEKYGPDQDIVVDEDGIILKGHGRLRAAILLDRKDFPVTQRLGLTDVEKTAMRIADNQVALLSGWDNDLVAFEIKRLEREKFDLKLLGFGEAQLVQFTTQPGPPPGGFAAFSDETIETEHECPKCRYRWSGKSAPTEVQAPPKSESRSRGSGDKSGKESKRRRS